MRKVQGAGQAYGCPSVIQPLGRLRLEDHKIKAFLGKVVRSVSELEVGLGIIAQWVEYLACYT